MCPHGADAGRRAAPSVLRADAGRLEVLRAPIDTRRLMRAPRPAKAARSLPHRISERPSRF
jgi:hypothetical protein